MNPVYRHQTVRHLYHGGIIAYPTEAVYGLGCDPWNPDAVARLLAMKRRSWHKGVILIASRFEQLTPFILPLDENLRRDIFATWPGAMTWLLPVRPEVPAWLCGKHDTLAARVTAHPTAAQLCDAWGGALVSTSANPEGCVPARNARRVRAYFGAKLSIINAPLGGLSRPSEIRHGHTGKIIRAGG
jgi:L-threonylcarbamoyladenylate synthase